MSAAGSRIMENQKDFLKFLKGKFPLYHLSNVFFRDLHYGVMAYLEQSKLPAGYTSTEKVTQEVIAFLETKKVLRPMDGKTWLLDYPEFKATSAKKPAPAKPAPPKPAGASTAARPAVIPAGTETAAPASPAAPAPASVSTTAPASTTGAPSPSQPATPAGSDESK